MVSRAVLALLSGLLLGLSTLDSRLYLTGWIGFLPLLLALEGRSLRQSYLLGMLTGIVFWAAASYWLADFIVNLKGYPRLPSTLLAALFWVYAGQGFGLVALAYQWLRQWLRTGQVFILPLAFVAGFSLYPVLFRFRLGEAQTGFPLALQGADLVGAYGIDFMLALASAVLFFCWRRRGVGPWELLALGLLSGWFGYGALALHRWDAAIAEWPHKRIGIVQPNDPPSIDIPPPEPGYSRALPPELEMTGRLAAAGAELVVWPEARYKGYFDQRAVRDAYEYSIGKHGVPLLFHDLERRQEAGRWRQYNAAALLDATGRLQSTYHKVKLFAFGEYTPLVGELPLVRKWVRGYFGDFLADITPGEGHEVWPAAGMRLVPKICYESAFPEFMAGAIGADAAGKVIVILSQDGWFGRSRQPYQHLWQSALRAVENRVPVVHAINGGPSGVILPSGRIAFQSRPFVRGEHLVAVPYAESSGGSFYARHPYLFITVIYALFGGLLLWSLLAWRREARLAAPARP